MRKALYAALVALALLTGLACGSAGAPSPAEVSVPLRFTVTTTVRAVATYNVGGGAKHHDSIHAPGDSWEEGSTIGAHVSLSATPADRSQRGTIGVKIEYAATGKLLCHDTNFDKYGQSTSCGGKVK